VPEGDKNLFLIVVLSTPNGLFPPFLNASFDLSGPRSWDNFDELGDQENYFYSEDKKVAIISRPTPGHWTILSHGGSVPFSVNVMVFHPEIPPSSPPSPGSTGSSPFKCKACKITTKALALSIVAAAALSALPSALIAAVSTYLGAGAIVAGAFITSVLGDTADIIAEKLCKKVNLCP
jgi:hypothetical protein